MAFASIHGRRPKREIVLGLTAKDAKELESLANSARAYPGRRRVFPVGQAEWYRVQPRRHFESIVLVASQDIVEDRLQDYRGKELVFLLSSARPGIFYELLDEAKLGTDDYCFGFPYSEPGGLKHERASLWLWNASLYRAD